MKAHEMQQEALDRAQNGQTMSNFPAIYHGLMSKGIPQHAIQPRENVFTYQAWIALGRHVRKGEHGVRVVTFAKTSKHEVDPSTGKEKSTFRSYPKSTTVFHVSQTDANGANGVSK